MPSDIDESQLCRIDHYLGKMGLDEIVYLRFANTILDRFGTAAMSSVSRSTWRSRSRRGSRSLLRSDEPGSWGLPLPMNWSPPTVAGKGPWVA
jgi:hypothetical protein